MNRMAEIRPLPPELNRPGQRGYYLQGSNWSNDLFMYLKKQIVGLPPDVLFYPSMHIQVASNVPYGCGGIGGPPEAVFLKAGVTRTEAVASLQNGQLVLNLDKGNHGLGGTDIKAIGDIGNGQPCTALPSPYVMLERVVYFYERPVRSNSDGSLWVTVGTDSAFLGTTGIYYYTIGLVLLPTWG